MPSCPGFVVAIALTLPLIAAALWMYRAPVEPSAQRDSDHPPPLEAHDKGVEPLTHRIMTWVAIGAVSVILVVRAATAPDRFWDRLYADSASLSGRTSDSPLGGLSSLKCWRPEEWMALCLPIVVLPFLALLFHRLDAKRGGGGIKDRIGALPHPHSRLTPDVIAATMTKQSILAAIAAIFLASEEKGSLAATEFSRFSIGLSRLGFAVALLLLTVSVLAYDYANRFELRREEKYELVRKGLSLDVLSWYVLLASYIVNMASTNVRTSILVSIITGFLVQWYYFIKPLPFPDPPNDGAPNSR